MSDFVRMMIPHKATWPKFPSGLDSWGLSGKGQFRSTLQVGRSWEEEYPAIKWNNANHRAFLAYVNSLFRERTIFTISHYHLQTPLGTMSGGGAINGANQTGSTLAVTGCTSTGATALKQGDVIKLPGVNLIYDVTADVAQNATSIPISPPIFTGGSPTNGQAITYTAVKFRCVIEEITMPTADNGLIYRGLKIKFRECP